MCHELALVNRVAVQAGEAAPPDDIDKLGHQ
jgi:hypothetical protein